MENNLETLPENWAEKFKAAFVSGKIKTDGLKTFADWIRDTKYPEGLKAENFRYGNAYGFNNFEDELKVAIKEAVEKVNAPQIAAYYIDLYKNATAFVAVMEKWIGIAAQIAEEEEDEAGGN